MAIKEELLTSRVIDELIKFINLIGFGKMILDSDKPHIELAERVLDESGYTGVLETRELQDQRRLENLKELIVLTIFKIYKSF